MKGAFVHVWDQMGLSCAHAKLLRVHMKDIMCAREVNTCTWHVKLLHWHSKVLHTHVKLLRAHVKGVTYTREVITCARERYYVCTSEVIMCPH